MKRNGSNKKTDYLLFLSRLGYTFLQATAATTQKRYEQYKTGGYTSLSKKDDALSLSQIVRQAHMNLDEMAALDEKIEEGNNPVTHSSTNPGL